MTSKLLPYEVIVRSTSGDTEAISTVIKHFDPYINRLSMRPGKNEDGSKIYYYLNEDIKLDLHIELIVKLPLFDPLRF